MSRLRLLVVRHGGTEWSRELRFTGSRDVPLSAEGRRQAEAVATALGGRTVAAICASPLARARDSAELIARPHGLAVEIEADLREMGFGAWEGLTREEVAARFPEAYALWRSAPHRFRAAGAEPLAEVAERARRAVAALASAQEGQTVVVVSHAIVLRLIVLQALGLGPDRLWTVDASPAGITEIEYEPGWATVCRMNTLSHLDTVVR